MEELQKEIERIRREQEELVFAAFDEETAWETGKRLRQTALEKGYAVAISVTLNRRRLFACAMAGTTPINDEWIRRKENTVYKFFKSSYEMSLYMKPILQQVLQSLFLLEDFYLLPEHFYYFL